jgi:hypothetical protein
MVEVPSPSLLFPKNNSIVNTLKPELSWNFLFDKPEEITYDIYLGPNKSSIPFLISISNKMNYSSLNTLTDKSTYYWMVVPHINDISGDPSEIWTFTVDLGLTQEYKLQLDLDRNTVEMHPGENISINLTVMNDGTLDGLVKITLNTNLSREIFNYRNEIFLLKKTKDIIHLNISIPSNTSYGEYTINIIGELGNSTSKKVLTLSIINGTVPIPSTNPPVVIWQEPIFWGILVVVSIIAGAGISYQTITKRKARKELDDVRQQAECIEDFEIDEIFLIYQDGRLITHVSRKESGIDDQIFGSMLIAIQSFVKDSFQSEEGLTSFEFGSRKMILEKGNRLFLSVALTGVEPDILRQQMHELVQKLEGLYAGIVEEWDGDIVSFKDAEHTLVALFGIKDGLKIKQEKEEVKVRSGVEFFSGYVRLKISIKNELSTKINEVSLSLDYDQKVLRLDHIDPEYPMSGSTVVLDSIEKDEKRTIAFYLDPLICQESHVAGKVTFTDNFGIKGDVEMKKRPIDIICPIFYTKETVNVAMLKRLLNELAYHDSKIFNITDRVALKQVYEITNEIARGYDIKFIREFKNEQQLEMESWYYGEVKEMNEKLIIRITARESQKIFEIFVASSNLATLTGLLAELGGRLRKKVDAQIELSGRIISNTDENLKDEVAHSKLLIEKQLKIEK